MTTGTHPQRVMALAVQRFDRTLALFSRAAPLENMFVIHGAPGTTVEGLVNGTFDAAELPVARSIFLCGRGDPITFIPVFTDRLFIQQYIYTRPDTGIRSTADLKGRRVFCPQFFMTACIWHKGMLKEDHGIGLEEVEWFTGGPERPGMQIPDGINVTVTPAPNMGLGLLLDGTVDCIMLEATPPIALENRHKIVRVHQDVGDLQREFYRTTGHHVAVHMVGVRRAAVEERPELLEQLCEAFDQAKALAYRSMQNERLTSMPLMRTYLDETRELFGDDPWSYGFEPNRAMLEKVMGYAHGQGLTPRQLSPEEMFDEPVRKFQFKAKMPEGSTAWAFPPLL
jgi:4,5-dihydroxyphthalate decarboxylase